MHEGSSEALADELAELAQLAELALAMLADVLADELIMLADELTLAMLADELFCYELSPELALRGSETSLRESETPLRGFEWSGLFGP